jgi:hypothetical protein
MVITLYFQLARFDLSYHLYTVVPFVPISFPSGNEIVKIKVKGSNPYWLITATTMIIQ